MTTEPPPDERSDGTNSRRSPERSRSWWPVLAPAVALVVGLLIGGVVVGVADDDDVPSTSPTPSSSPTLDDPTGSPAEGATTIVVPDACLEAVDTVEEATQLTRDGAAAIRDFEPAELRSLLTELEELDQRAREQAQACREADVQ
jgi:hypothetical protein